MKNGWKTHRLEEVCREITDGSHFSPKTSDKGYPYITVRDIEDDEVNFSRCKFIAAADYNQLLKNGCRPNKGDILFSKDGTVGKVALIDYDKEFVVLSSLAIVRPDSSRIESAFLKWILKSPGFFDEAVGKKTGAAIRRIILRNLKSIPIPVPPLPEQQRIVGILDEVFAGLATAKANAEKNLQNARALFESHLQSVLGSKKWKWKTLGELCDGVEYGSSAKSKKEGKVPVLRMGNIQDGRLDWSSLVYTDDKEEIQKYLLKHNDVLFNRTNSPELVGKTAIYKSEMPAIFAGYLIRIQRKEDLLDADYLNYFLNSQIAFDYGKTVVISSVNQANINGAKLKGYPIPAPSILEQRSIVKGLDALSEETQRLASLYEQKLAELEALKKSLLHHAFTGQLK